MQQANLKKSLSQKSHLLAKAKKGQQGFTLVELVVVMAILALIIAVMSSDLFQSKEDAKVQAARTQLTKDFPSAITRILTMTNLCSSTTIDKAKLVARGAPAQTVFGLAWAVSTSAGNTVTITYPLDLDDTTLATSLKDALTLSPNVKSVTSTSSQVVVSYRCN